MIVFLSHSTKDDSVVSRIRQALEHLRIEVWDDSQRLAPGDQLTPEIQQTFCLLSNLERAESNEPEWLKAREQGMQAYLAYRRAGAESQAPGARLCMLVAWEPDAAEGELAALRQEPNLPDCFRALIQQLEAVLAGSRDAALADDPGLYYRDAAELLLLMEKLG